MASDILQHTECPRCGAPNLSTELVCFACGANLRPVRRRRPGHPPPEAPWPLWIGLIFALLVAGFAGYHLAAWLAGYRERAVLPVWYLPLAGLLLGLAGRLAFREARRRDRRWWRLSRAPHLPLTQCHTGDAVWVRGKLQCDGPLIAPFVAQECAYYRYVLREREQGEGGWRVTERQTKVVDFRVADGEKSVYVPSGDVLLDAPLYVETYLDLGGTRLAKVWALPVGLLVSVCGQLAGGSRRPRMDRLGEDLPVVATWREPGAYVQLVAKRAKKARVWGWALTILGALLLIAGLARV